MAIVLALTSCGRRAERAIARDPAPALASSSAPAPAPIAPPSKLTLFHGHVFDLSAPRLVAALDVNPYVEAIHDDAAYLVARTGDLSAYDASKRGAPRWKVHAMCDRLFAIDAGVVCTSDKLATFYASSDGASHPLAAVSATSIIGGDVLPENGGLVLLRVDGGIDRYDRDGVHAGGVVAPQLALGYGGVAFTLLGRFACAAQLDGDDAVFPCVDPGLLSKTTKIPVVVFKVPVRTLTAPPSMGFWFRLHERMLVIQTSARLGGPGRSIVLRKSDNTEIARVETSIAGLVENGDGSLDGLLQLDHGTLSVLELSGATRWSTKTTATWQDSAAALRVGDTIAVATFDAIATGADLHAYDAKTGALRWTGALELLPIGHSEYYNDVTLTLEGGWLVVRGVEAGQVYLEAFDPKTGARVLSDDRPT